MCLLQPCISVRYLLRFRLVCEETHTIALKVYLPFILWPSVVCCEYCNVHIFDISLVIYFEGYSPVLIK